LIEEKQQTIRFTAAALVTVLLWASAFPIVKYILAFYSAESIMLLRFLVASLTMAVISAIKKIKLPNKKDIPFFAAAGFFGMFVYMWCFNTGTNMVPSGVSSVLISAAPVYVTLLSVLILKEKVRLFCWIGVLVSFGGQFIIAASEIIGFAMNIGVVLLVAASICTSVFTIIQRRLLKTYGVFEVTAYAIFFGTLFMMIFLPDLIREMPLAPIEANLFTVYLGIFPAAIAYLTWSYALSKAKNTANATIFLYLIPLAASLMAFLWLKETISPLAFAGGLIIILGMIISNVLGQKTK
jgi:drug/metabolite transporter (DMT)-like permease